MKRKHKTYSKPKRPFDKARIEEEAKIIEEFGLKNKREIWKADARIKEIREKAKNLISADSAKQEKLFERLKKMGFNVNSIGNVLSLDKKDYLKRRLQTVLVDKRLAKSTKSSRQLIVHRKVMVDGKAIDSPSYIVPIELEGKITIKIKKEKPKEKPVKTAEEKENEGNS
ncbi:MAG: 30S ribosomal protein S4 [Nanoarchaeota archaeon]